MGQYAKVMMGEYNTLMAAKLGMVEYEREVTVGLMELMYEHRADFTNTFRSLLDVCTSDPEDSLPESLKAVCPPPPGGICTAPSSLQQSFSLLACKWRTPLIEFECTKTQSPLPCGHFLSASLIHGEHTHFPPFQIHEHRNSQYSLCLHKLSDDICEEQARADIRVISKPLNPKPPSPYVLLLWARFSGAVCTCLRF